MGAAAKAAQRSEALGVVPPHNTMRPSNRGFPQTLADWEGLLRSTRRKDNNKALHMAQAFVTQAQNTLAVQQTEPQRLVLKEWTYPDWFTPALCKGKARAARAGFFIWALGRRSNRSHRDKCHQAATSHVPGVAPATWMMCGLTCPDCGTSPKCGQCGLTSTQTSVRMALWSCPTAAYQCVAYVGCS
jgi:hypothetical protein